MLRDVASHFVGACLSPSFVRGFCIPPDHWLWLVLLGCFTQTFVTGTEDAESAGSAVGGGTLGPEAEGALGALLGAPWLMATARRRTAETTVLTVSSRSSSQALEACRARPCLCHHHRAVLTGAGTG